MTRTCDLHRGRTRTAARNEERRQPERVDLTEAAVGLLETIPRVQGTPYVFAGHHNGKPISVSTIDRRWREAREAAGVEDVTIHDLRRSCGSWLAMGGASLLVIGQVLGHKSARATEVYARLLPGAGREALEGWSRLLAITDPSDADGEKQ